MCFLTGIRYTFSLQFFIFPNQLPFSKHHLISVTTVNADHHCQALWSITSRSSILPGTGNSETQTESQSLETRGLITETKWPAHKKRNDLQCRIYEVSNWWHITPVCHGKVRWTPEAHFLDLTLLSGCPHWLFLPVYFTAIIPLLASKC